MAVRTKVRNAFWPLDHWGHGFESHPEMGICSRFLCVWIAVRRQRPCDRPFPVYGVLPLTSLYES
jgi:hypothetical protein